MRRADRLFQIIQVLRRSSKPVTADAMAAEVPGAAAASPLQMPPRAWGAIAKRVYVMNDFHNLALLAAGVAFFAFLAFVPLTTSVFWGSMAYTLIGGTAVGTIMILLFLPALYAAWFRIKPPKKEDDVAIAGEEAPVQGEDVPV